MFCQSQWQFSYYYFKQEKQVMWQKLYKLVTSKIWIPDTNILHIFKTGYAYCSVTIMIWGHKRRKVWKQVQRSQCFSVVTGKTEFYCSKNNVAPFYHEENRTIWGSVNNLGWNLKCQPCFSYTTAGRKGWGHQISFVHWGKWNLPSCTSCHSFYTNFFICSYTFPMT